MVDRNYPFHMYVDQPTGLGGFLYTVIFEGHRDWLPYYMAVHLAGSVLVLLLAWALTENCRRAYFRVAMRSLALAFTFCFVIPFIMYLPPFPMPGWPFLFLGSKLNSLAWATFTLEFAVFHRWLWKRELRKVPGKTVFYEHQARNWWRPPERWIGSKRVADAQ